MLCPLKSSSKEELFFTSHSVSILSAGAVPLCERSRLEKVECVSMCAAEDVSLYHVSVLTCQSPLRQRLDILPDLVASLLHISPLCVTLEHVRPVEQEEDSACVGVCVHVFGSKSHFICEPPPFPW